MAKTFFSSFSHLNEIATDGIRALGELEDHVDGLLHQRDPVGVLQIGGRGNKDPREASEHLVTLWKPIRLTAYISLHLEIQNVKPALLNCDKL